MSKTILVVDDSKEDNATICEMVRRGGYQTISAFDGESGVKMAKENKPALVVMDVVMPGINGFQATKMITRDEGTSNIPVVICSNKHQETDKAWGIKNGAKYYFVKPANGSELLSKIKELLGS